jgi:hypothetical protein
MKLIKGYSQWLNENLNPIFENWEISSIYPSTPDFSVDDAKYDQYLASTVGAQYRQFTQEVAKSNVNNIKTKELQQEIFGALVKNGQTAKRGFLGLFGNKSLDTVANASLDSLLAGKSKISYSKVTVDYNPTEAGPSIMKTSGKISPSSTVINTDPKFAKSTSATSTLLRFVNVYNSTAFAEGKGQFILSKRMQDDGYLDLMTAPTEDKENLYLYAQQLLGDLAAGKEVKVDVAQTGGSDAVSGKYSAEFAAGSDQLTPAIQAEVAKAVELCLAKFPAGQRPDKFTLTSGASTEWNGKNMPKAEGAGAVTPKDDATKNQDLAYRRGVSFMKALNAGLKAKGHPGFDSFEVNWSIGVSGQQANPADRFVDLNIEKNAVKPKAKETTSLAATSTGAAVTNVREKAQFYELKLTLTVAAQA